MKLYKYSIVLVLLFVLSTSQKLWAQNPVNWTNEQLMEPAQLAKTIESGKDIPVIFSVGPGALIPHSISVGPVQEKKNLETFRKELTKLPKDAKIVVYCGCCPFEHCPNARPAIALLKELNFTNYQLLNLPHNLKADWLDKGYPKVEKL